MIGWFVAIICAIACIVAMRRSSKRDREGRSAIASSFCGLLFLMGTMFAIFYALGLPIWS